LFGKLSGDFGMSGYELNELPLPRRGLSSKEIAPGRRIAEATVKVHVQALLHKAQAGNRIQLLMWAISVGLERVPALADSDGRLAKPT
jgi:DNA-binding CsgD family transcriptional regulator